MGKHPGNVGSPHRSADWRANDIAFKKDKVAVTEVTATQITYCVV